MPICAFCGTDFKGKTKDHVPPRGLFGDKPTHNLITVPACPKCNNDTSKDDEYFRLIAMSIEVESNPVAQQVNQSTLRAIFRPEKAKFKRSLFRVMRQVELTSASGLYLGQSLAIKLQGGRILNTVKKTVRGLFYRHRGYPVPADYEVNGYPMRQLHQHFPDLWESSIKPVIIPCLMTQPVHDVVPEVFRYRCYAHPDELNTMFFLLGFYNRIDFLGFVWSPQIGEDGDEPDDLPPPAVPQPAPRLLTSWLGQPPPP